MKTRYCAIATCVLLGISSLAQADTYNVNYLADYADQNPGDGICAGNGNVNYCTLRAAVQTANAHTGADIIVVPGGTYVLSLHGAGEDAAATGDLDITDSVTIQTKTAGIVPTIDGDGADRVFDIRGQSPNLIDVTLFGLRLTHGTAAPVGIQDDELGGAIRAGSGSTSSYLGNFNIDYCIIDNNVATGGGGIHLNTHGIVSMQYVLLTANQATPLSGTGGAFGSAAILRAPTISLLHTATVANLASSTPGTQPATLVTGGGYQGNIEITDSTIAANPGTGLNVSGKTVYLNNVSVLDNGYPGGLIANAVSQTYSTALTIRNAIFAANASGGGHDCLLSQSSGTLTVDAAGPNIDSDGSCQLDSPSGGLANTSMAVLRLAPLGYYGLLPSRPPMSGSVAIDTGSSAAINSGDPSCGAYDQNGAARPFDGNGDSNARCDIGAIEYHGDLIFIDGFQAQ